MTIRTSLFCALLAAGAAATPSVGSARAYVDIDIAPPPPPSEVIPPPRVGFEWAPGYYEYRHRRHHWHHGYWVRARHGHHWVAAHWVEHHGRWHFEAGHWD